jgi:hypothetical protein
MSLSPHRSSAQHSYDIARLQTPDKESARKVGLQPDAVMAHLGTSSALTTIWLGCNLSHCLHGFHSETTSHHHHLAASAGTMPRCGTQKCRVLTRCLPSSWLLLGSSLALWSVRLDFSSALPHGENVALLFIGDLAFWESIHRHWKMFVRRDQVATTSKDINRLLPP